MDTLPPRTLPMDAPRADAGQSRAEFPTAAAPAPARRGLLRRVVLPLGITALLAGAGWFGYDWWTTGRFIQSTDDAYTAADSVGVAARIGGQVTEVLVGDNEKVEAGQVLARLDPRDTEAALSMARADVQAAEADLATAQAQLALQASTIAAAEADLRAQEAQTSFARQEGARYADLLRSGSGSAQRAQATAADIEAREAGLARAVAAVSGARLQVQVLQGSRARAEAGLARARANLQQAELNASYATITAPIAGEVGDRSLRLGQKVATGTRVLELVPLGRSIFVAANFKETQLSHMRPGQDVEVAVDALPGETLHGKVDSLAPGSGSQFALLPPENATGNFVKIVQRVTVRIRLAGVPAAALERLRPGLSVTASVDTRG